MQDDDERRKDSRRRRKSREMKDDCDERKKRMKKRWTETRGKQGAEESLPKPLLKHHLKTHLKKIRRILFLISSSPRHYQQPMTTISDSNSLHQGIQQELLLLFFPCGNIM